ncbi:MAG: lipocalin family protein [Cytophagales bacterium]|nr:lipocalin family protein [Cytophagales bacterium]
MKKITWILVLLVGFLAACNGGGDDPQPSNTELLSKNWQWVKGTVNGAPYTPQNLVGMEFRADGTYTIRGRNANDSNGTWAFNSNETKIILDGQGELTIITLNANTLVYEFESVNYKDGRVVTRYEFKPA